MNAPLTIVMWLLAALPIIVLLYLMLCKKWGVSKAAPAGLSVAILVAILFYKANLPLILYESLKGLWSALTVITIIWPAILIFEVTHKAKAFQVFRTGMQKLVPNELLQVLVVGWVFTSFLQGVTGFGVPVAVGAPLLTGMGVSPFWAVIIPPIGHSWGNTFGTLAIAWDSLVAITELNANPVMKLRTILWATSLIWMWNAISGFAITLFYGGRRAIKKGWPAVFVISLIQGGGQMLIARYNTALACFLPCCGALVASLIMGRMKRYRDPWRLEDSPIMSRITEVSNLDGSERMSLNQAFLPYYILASITLIVLLIEPIRVLFSTIRIGFSFPHTTTGYGFNNPAISSFAPVAPFSHAGVFLLISAISGYCYYLKKGWIQRGDGSLILKRSVRKTFFSSIAVICFNVMSRVMSGSGQTDILARGMASLLGKEYLLFTPMVGLLGSFMTSSNMSSNILFSSFQLTTAEALSLDAAAVLGAQTAGGAIGSTICPGNIILGTTTTGTLGLEGIILRRVLPIAIGAALVAGAIVYMVLVWVGG